MPELVSVYEQIVELAGGGDIEARFLSLYCPAPYLGGCSQVVWQKDQPTYFSLLAIIFSEHTVADAPFAPAQCEILLLAVGWIPLPHQPVLGRGAA